MKIVKTEKRPHRNSTFSEFVFQTNYMINEINMFIVKSDSDNLWWLIPAFLEDELTTIDIGPFSNVDTCKIYATLVED